MVKIQDKAMTVVVGNTLIQNRQPDNRSISTKLSYNLDIYQQKIIAILMAYVGKDDTDFKPLTLSFRQFCALADIKYGGKTYDLLWESLNNLAMATFTVRETRLNAKGQEKHVTGIYHWIDNIIVHEEENVVDIKLDNSLKPFLLGLDDAKKYIIYELGCMLSFRRKWSGLLYQWLKSHQGHKTIQIGIDTLKLKLMTNTDTYKTPRDFILYVIEPALKEINDFTDIDVSFRKNMSKPAGGGREKITGLTFTVRKKTQEQYEKIKDSVWGLAVNQIEGKQVSTKS